MNPLIPSPRDWPEDAAHENGNYLCRCCGCHETFIGYKRRVVCKVCSDRDAAEAKLRAEWLTAHKAPANWTILTIEEVRAMHADYADQLLRLHVEQQTRRELSKQVGDLLFQMQCAATMGAGFAANHPMLKDVRAAHAKSKKLDEVAP